MALAFWAITGDFELSWWLPNAYLLLFPIPLLVQLAQMPQILNVAPAGRPPPDPLTRKCSISPP